MIVVAAVLIAAPFAVTAVIVAAVSRRPLTRVAERHGEHRVLRATPSHQRHAERLPAASTARQVYRITDLPGAHQGARANREG